MRLTAKFIVTLVAGILIILAVHAWVSFQREVDLFDFEMRREAHVLGRAVERAVVREWKRDKKEALELVKEANANDSHVTMRWVWLDPGAKAPYQPRVPRELLGKAIANQEESHRVPGHNGSAGLLYTYFPVSIAGEPRHGAIELAESLALEKRYVRTTLRNTVIATLVLVGVCGLLASVLGVFFVGRPTRMLSLKARRVGAGDLSGPLHLRQRDELGNVAQEMNAMCDRLAEANKNLRAEVAARLATMEQLRHADRLTTVGKLASGIAHELGTPLNVVAGRAQMIASGDATGDEARDNARIIREQSKRMTATIRQLLDFARRRGPHKEEADLGQITRTTLELLEPLAAKQGVELAGPPAEPVVTGRVDESQLQQVLTNLVVNAVQASRRGQQVEVAVGHERVQPPADLAGPEASYLSIAVTDHGHGMDSETAAHVFEPFFTTKEVGEGTGLGLSVAYGIVREHGGWIAVKSARGAGSTFTIYLPEAETETAT